MRKEDKTFFEGIALGSGLGVVGNLAANFIWETTTSKFTTGLIAFVSIIAIFFIFLLIEYENKFK